MSYFRFTKSNYRFILKQVKPQVFNLKIPNSLGFFLAVQSDAAPSTQGSFKNWFIFI